MYNRELLKLFKISSLLSSSFEAKYNTEIINRTNVPGVRSRNNRLGVLYEAIPKWINTAKLPRITARTRKEHSVCVDGTLRTDSIIFSGRKYQEEYRNVYFHLE